MPTGSYPEVSISPEIRLELLNIMLIDSAQLFDIHTFDTKDGYLMQSCAPGED